MSFTITETTRLVTQVCANCGVLFALPEYLYEQCRENPFKEFFCPNGHTLVFKKSSLQEQVDSLRRERDDAQRASSIMQHRLQVKDKEVKKLTNKMKRVTAGVCPCCNRSFKQLAEHMRTQHPEIVKAKEESLLHKKINSK